MEAFDDIDFKSIVFGAAIAAACVIVGSWGGTYQYAYPFAAIGLIYVGYKAKNIPHSIILGAFAATPIAYLAFDGYFGQFTGFFATEAGTFAILIIILIIGAFIGLVGGWAKRDRVRAKEEYEKQQKIGKNKTRERKQKKNSNVKETEEKKGFLNKILKK